MVNGRSATLYLRATTAVITLSGAMLAMGAPVKWGLRIGDLASLF